MCVPNCGVRRPCSRATCTACGDHLGVDDPQEEVAAAPLGSAAGATGAAGAAGAAVAAGAVLAERLGHLPLALALAAAYMRACDVSCGRYLRRLEAAAGAGMMQGYARGVAESFELSLRQLDGVRLDADLEMEIEMEIETLPSSFCVLYMIVPT